MPKGHPEEYGGGYMGYGKTTGQKAGTSHGSGYKGVPLGTSKPKSKYKGVKLGKSTSKSGYKPL